MKLTIELFLLTQVACCISCCLIATLPLSTSNFILGKEENHRVIIILLNCWVCGGGGGGKELLVTREWRQRMASVFYIV